MPILPRYLPQQPVEGGIRLPPKVPVADIGQAITASFGPAAQMFEDAQAKLKAQQDEIDFARMQGEYHAGMEDLRINLQTDPDYLGRERKFFLGAKALQDKIIQGARDANVQKAFTAYALKRTPMEAVGVRAESLKLWIGAQRDQLAFEGDESAKKAAQLPSEELRQEEADRYLSMLDRATQRGVYNPLESGRLKRVYMENVLDKQMDFLRRTDPQQMYFMDRRGSFAGLDPIKRLTHLEQARRDADQEMARNERAVKQAREAEELIWSADANQGLISDVRMTRALEGKDPYITPDRARQLQPINENPPTGAGTLQIRTVMEQYHGQERTYGTIRSARLALQKLHLEIGRPNKLLDSALNELQSDEMSLRSIRAQEIQAGIQLATDRFNANKTASPLGGMVKRMTDQTDAADLASIKESIRRGADPDKAVDRVMQQREADQKAVPNKNKAVLEAFE